MNIAGRGAVPEGGLERQDSRGVRLAVKEQHFGNDSVFLSLQSYCRKIVEQREGGSRLYSPHKKIMKTGNINVLIIRVIKNLISPRLDLSTFHMFDGVLSPTPFCGFARQAAVLLRVEWRVEGEPLR